MFDQILHAMENCPEIHNPGPERSVFKNLSVFSRNLRSKLLRKIKEKGLGEEDVPKVSAAFDELLAPQAATRYGQLVQDELDAVFRHNNRRGNRFLPLDQAFMNLAPLDAPEDTPTNATPATIDI